MNKFSFKAKIWKFDGPAGWYFVTLPKTLSRKIRSQLKDSEEGWGRLKAQAQIGDTYWKTAIWFDTKADSYLLPIKTEIRKKNKIGEGVSLKVNLQFEPEKIWRLK